MKADKSSPLMLHDSEQFSDCTIVCGPCQFKAHKFLLSTHSEYFSKAFQIDTFKEGESGQLELKATQPDSEDSVDACDDPEIVKWMIHYFYHLDYLNSQSQEDPTRAPETEVHLVEHAKVFAMTIKYQVQGLRNLAASKFEASVAKHWKHDDFSHATYIVYTSTPDDITALRKIVATPIHDNIRLFRKKEEIQSLLRSIPGLAYDLLELELALGDNIDIPATSRTSDY